MATTLYPTSVSSTRSSSSQTAPPTYKVLSLTRGAGVTSVVDGSVASLATLPAASGLVACVNGGAVSVTSGTTPENPGSPGSWLFISEPLAAVTISGTITVNHRALESNAKANEGCQAFVYKVASGNGAATKIGMGANTTELGTVEAATSISITPTSTALANGDMLMLMLAFGSAGGTSASGNTVTTFLDGTSSGASGDTFVTFTETIGLATATAPIPDVGMALTVT